MGKTLVFTLRLLFREGWMSLAVGLWIAYVMYNDKDRIESADMFCPTMTRNALRKSSKTSSVNVSDLRVSSHFLRMPEFVN